MNDKAHPELAKSDVIQHMPKACSDETAAVEFFERQRWGDSPLCPHYCDELTFRWDTRKLNDSPRVVEAVKRAEAKRLT